MGAEVAAFEQEFAAFTGSQHAVMVNSGSSANLLMVAASTFRRRGRRLQRGDEVLVPAVSWATTYFPLSQHGLVLRFVDIDPQTLNFDLAALEAAVTPRTAAVMAVNLLGNPNDFAVLQALARRHDLVLLEDNCESLGASFEGRQAGTFGLAGSFSFFFSHHMSTMEGGMVVTDDQELYELMLSLRAHGWTRNLPTENLVTGRKSDDPFVESFRFVLPGYNLRPLEMEAAVGREQLAQAALLPGSAPPQRRPLPQPPRERRPLPAAARDGCVELVRLQPPDRRRLRAHPGTGRRAAGAAPDRLPTGRRRRLHPEPRPGAPGARRPVPPGARSCRPRARAVRGQRP